jgi:signal transduction histidine kinase
MRRITSLIGDGFTGWLAASICASVTLLSWFGYHAISEWRQSSLLLAERRVSGAADLLLEALTRDMRGAQESVLASPQWSDFATERPYEMSNLVASTFARYPYPESLFAWRVDAAGDRFVFYNRSDRRPPWMSRGSEPGRFPVVIDYEPDISGLLRHRIMKDTARGHRVSVFEMNLGGTPYQIVAQLTYRDAFREQLGEVVGFMVNLPWVREHYFSELTRQVSQIGSGAETELRLSVVDSHSKPVVGSRLADGELLTTRRPFPLMFFDPQLILLDPPHDLPQEPWMVEVSAANDPTLAQALSASDNTLMIGGISALALTLGLMLAVGAQKAGAKLTEMRSDFVSTVTHELKTPIATIRAAAETLSQGRLTGIDAFQSYGRLVVVEAKRLTRLVENLLAYARVTDIADIYQFEPIDLITLFASIQEDFQTQLDDLDFDVRLDVPSTLPRVKGDHLALRLLFDNLIDNAMRYSDKKRRLHITAQREARAVRIDVADHGIGIAAEEIPLVIRKFVRGRRAPSGGSGLGLAIANRIARDHQGSLAIRSVVGQGTTVTVRLPLA